MADYFCHLADAIGLPKSVALIYHCLFVSEKPLSLGDIVTTTQLSKASASTGIRLLLQMRFIQQDSPSSERRAYYKAELSLRRLLSGFIKQTVSPSLATGQQLLEQASTDHQRPTSPLLRSRLQSLKSWNEGAQDLIPLIESLEFLDD